MNVVDKQAWLGYKVAHVNYTNTAVTGDQTQLFIEYATNAAQ